MVRPLTIFGALIHAGAVLAFTGAPFGTVAYFAAAGVLVAGRAWSGSAERYYRPFAVLVWVGLSLWFRGELDAPATGWGRVDRVFALDLGFVGLSYAFLRTVRALLAPVRLGPIGLLRYWFFFPTFFSGPVTEPEVALARRPSREDFAVGLGRILRGMVWIGASYALQPLVPLGSNNTFAHALVHWSTPALWGGAFASGVWLYLNFSGFSDVFIGLARMLGAEVPENFANPYAAVHLTDFWQRWHMSLGTWLRASIYTPLSKGLIPLSPTLAALLVPVVTMLACGAWHGVTWAFVTWGGLHGVGLAAHQVWQRTAAVQLPQGWSDQPFYRGASWLFTHAWVAMAWVFFLPVSNLGWARRLDMLMALFGGRS